MALDVRPGDQYSVGHVPASINIPLSGQFASWAGTLLRMARVGIEDVRGFLQDGVEGWKQEGFHRAQISQITAGTLNNHLRAKQAQLLDVRRESEWQAGHIEGAAWWPLDNFRVAAPEIDHTTPLAVHCQSGYRSMIACSLLQRAGFSNITDVTGGFAAWQQEGFPIEAGNPVVA